MVGLKYSNLKYCKIRIAFNPMLPKELITTRTT